MSHAALQRCYLRPVGWCLSAGRCIQRRRLQFLLPTYRVALCTSIRSVSTTTTSSKDSGDASSHDGTSAASATPHSSNSSEGEMIPTLTPMKMFFDLVSPLIATAPCVTKILTVYGNLQPQLDKFIESSRGVHYTDASRSTHRWIRTQFGSLSNGLQRLHATNDKCHWGIYVSGDKVDVVKAYSAEEAEEAFTATRMLRLQASLSSMGEAESPLEVFHPVFPCFTPPPPPAVGLRPVTSKKNKGFVPDGMFTPQMLVQYVPTFFIPMEELLTVLPEGYTVDHIKNIFAATGALEIVTLEGEAFVRMHGGKRLVDFTSDDSGEIAHNRWRQYQPDPFLCEPFHRLLLSLSSSSSCWMSLRQLITGAPASLLRALLPWENYKTLLFFAQMQHVFSFTPEGEGGVSWVAPVTCLSFHDSPTPAVVSELVGILGAQRVCIADLLAQSIHRISDHAKTQIIIYYGGLLNFFRVHGDVFCVNEDTTVSVSSQGTGKKPLHTLEDKLEEALVRRNRQTAQKLRRRIALERDPDNAYADKDVLLDAILRYVPQKRSISLNFLLRSLPPSLTDFLPSKPISLFLQAPNKIRVFEYRYRNRLHLIRPGVTLPPGVLREHYTERELLYLCAAELQQQPRTSCDLYGRLPHGAKEIIRLQYKGTIGLLRPYPQYFTVVFKDALRMDTRTALVTLIQMPPAVELTEEDYGAVAPADPEQRQKMEEEDREAIKTLPEDIQKTMRVVDNE